MWARCNGPALERSNQTCLESSGIGLKSCIVKVQTTLVAGPGFGPIFGSARNGSVFGIGGFGPRI
jgi:hypothetical protein